LIAGFPINIAGIRGGAGVEPPVMSSGFTWPAKPQSRPAASMRKCKRLVISEKSVISRSPCWFLVKVKASPPSRAPRLLFDTLPNRYHRFRSWQTGS